MVETRICRRRHGEKWLDSGYIFNVDLTEFKRALVECERNRELKNDS